MTAIIGCLYVVIYKCKSATMPLRAFPAKTVASSYFFRRRQGRPPLFKTVSNFSVGDPIDIGFAHV